jgi:hypothetical protein
MLYIFLYLVKHRLHLIENASNESQDLNLMCTLCPAPFVYVEQFLIRLLKFYMFLTKWIEAVRSKIKKISIKISPKFPKRTSSGSVK